MVLLDMFALYPRYHIHSIKGTVTDSTYLFPVDYKGFMYRNSCSVPFRCLSIPVWVTIFSGTERNKMMPRYNVCLEKTKHDKYLSSKQ